MERRFHAERLPNLQPHLIEFSTDSGTLTVMIASAQCPITLWLHILVDIPLTKIKQISGARYLLKQTCAEQENSTVEI